MTGKLLGQAKDRDNQDTASQQGDPGDKTVLADECIDITVYQ